ncbi:MAG: hypothetical protein QJQ54_00215 [Mollicutes bacterium]|nr:MAG: hypothetical protein QJQ54_00215 [Mollicutes bacterium]
MPKKIFSETENPVCLALFVPKKLKSKTNLFIGKKEIGSYKEILKKIKKNCSPREKPVIVKFNV